MDDSKRLTGEEEIIWEKGARIRHVVYRYSIISLLNQYIYVLVLYCVYCIVLATGTRTYLDNVTKPCKSCTPNLLRSP